MKQKKVLKNLCISPLMTQPSNQSTKFTGLIYCIHFNSDLSLVVRELLYNSHKVNIRSIIWFINSICISPLNVVFVRNQAVSFYFCFFFFFYIWILYNMACLSVVTLRGYRRYEKGCNIARHTCSLVRPH